MKSSVEQLDPTRVKISVEVPYAELKPSVDEAYKTIGSQVNVPGFRQGKVPTRIIDQRVGRPTVIQEAINNGLDAFYRDAVEANDLKPLGQPEVEISEVPGLDGTEDGDLVFTVDVDVRPEITLPAYDSITVEVDPIEVTDADVENELEQLRSRFGTLTSVDRPAAKDDFVTLDLVAKIDDEEIDSASDISYQVGAGTMLEGMDEALEGLSADESTTFSTTFAGGEHEGEEGTVTVTLKAVKERELPEADDDFAQLASEFDTIDELREDLKVQAGKQKEFAQGAEARDKVLEAIIEAVDVPVPAKIVTDEVERHLESENRVDDDEHRKEVTEETERNLRTQFVLDAIAEAEEVEVTQPELIEYLISASQQYGMNPNEFAQMLDNSGQVNALVGEVSRRKALAAALAGAVVKDTDGNVVDMEEFTSPADDSAETVSADDSEADDAEADETAAEDAKADADEK
ncbi:MULTISPECIES: trigger factor [Brevibacterium]|uniref:Trigger factor n=1 Tax=Brevibacterium casei TaxID=33889 RepID=A0A7T3ZXB5_9MICO|nr:trigger factor [Brevibacterium casei]QQB13421.1 trigger factor [Brevibacterium casei]